MSRPTLTPSWKAEDWLIVMRATWASGTLRSDAGKEAYHRGLELSADPVRHLKMLEEALLADDQERDAA